MATVDDVFNKLIELREDMGAFKTQMEFLMGNGQPGKIKEMEDAQRAQGSDISFAKGAVYIIGGLVVIALGAIVTHITFGAH